MTKTLWPERNKWYGHAYEIFALSTTSKGKWLIASSAKAKDAKHAEIFIWDLNSLNPIQKLAGHKYTAVQLEFSHDNKYLLSVGWDRIWCLFEVTDDGLKLV